MENSLYQKLHRAAMSVLHFVNAPLEAHDLKEPPKGVAAPLSEFGVAQKPITNQGRYTHIKYGASDIGKTGCIPIAIYNVLVLKGREGAALGELQAGVGATQTGAGMAQTLPNFEEIVERVKQLKAPLMGGRMGTDPYMIDKILEKYGVQCVEITEKESLSKAMDSAEKGTLFLITQWNDARRPLKGIHAYVAEKHANDKWALYNRVYRDYPTKAKNLTDIIGHGRLIVADRIL